MTYFFQLDKGEIKLGYEGTLEGLKDSILSDKAQSIKNLEEKIIELKGLVDVDMVNPSTEDELMRLQNKARLEAHERELVRVSKLDLSGFVIFAMEKVSFE